MFLFTILLCLSCNCLRLSTTRIDRNDSGDIFDVQTPYSCKSFNTECANDDCTRCHCYSKETYLQKNCYPDPAHTVLQGCDLAIDDNQYYGLKAYELERSGTTEIGYVVSNKRSDSGYFKWCSLSEGWYWNTKEWTKLLTDGRSTSDFRFAKREDGVQLKFYGKAGLYEGMLLKLNVECQYISFKSQSITSCMLLKFAGSRNYEDEITTTTTTTTSTTTTMATATTITTEEPVTTIITTLSTTATKFTNPTKLTSPTHPTHSTPPTHPTRPTNKTTQMLTSRSTPITRYLPTKDTSKFTTEEERLKASVIFLCTLLVVLTGFLLLCCYRQCCSNKRGVQTGILSSPTNSYKSLDNSTEISSAFTHLNFPTYDDIKELYETTKKKDLKDSEKLVNVPISPQQQMRQPNESIDVTIYSPHTSTRLPSL